MWYICSVPPTTRDEEHPMTRDEAFAHRDKARAKVTRLIRDGAPDVDVDAAIAERDAAIERLGHILAPDGGA